MQLPSVDVFIGLFFLFGIAYGFILQREKTITTLCSAYIGIVISTSFSQTLYEFFNGNKVIANQIWVKSNASTSTIAISLLLISTFFISGAINSRNKKSDEVSLFEVIVYSTLIVALLLSTILGFFPEATRNNYIETSIAARYLWNLRTFIVVTPPILLVILNWRKTDKKK